MNQNQEILNGKFVNAIKSLQNVREHCCKKDCHNCNFSIYNDDFGDICAIDHVMENLQFYINK